MLEIHNGSVQIGHKTLLHQIQASFNPATLYALLGANGSGKSTLLRALAGKALLTQGQVVCAQENLYQLSRRQVAGRISCMPQVFMQHSAFLMDLTVLEWVVMGCYCREGRQTSSSRQIALNALREVNMDSFASHLLHTLSQGQKQKIALARLLSMQTDIYLLDEPTAHLDIRQKEWVWNFLKQASNKGKLVIVATHDVDMARLYSHEALLIRRGQLLMQGLASSMLSETHIDQLYA